MRNRQPMREHETVSPRFDLLTVKSIQLTHTTASMAVMPAQSLTYSTSTLMDDPSHVDERLFVCVHGRQPCQHL